MKALRNMRVGLAAVAICLSTAGSASAAERTRDEAIKKALRTISQQCGSGGWQRRPYEQGSSTLDNGASHAQITSLARIYSRYPDPRIKRSIAKGVNFLFAAEVRPHGGFRQFWPLPAALGHRYWHKYITFNGGATGGAIGVLRAIAERRAPFKWWDDEAMRKNAAASVARLRALLPRIQIRVRNYGTKDAKYIKPFDNDEGGVRTGWCGQHDDRTLEAQYGRDFEPANCSPGFTTWAAGWLMSFDDPSPLEIECVQAAGKWLGSIAVFGKRQVLIGVNHPGTLDKSAPAGGEGWTRIMIDDPSAGWGSPTFTEIETGRAIFGGRSGYVGNYDDCAMKYWYSLDGISHERRAGSQWWTDGFSLDFAEKTIPGWIATWTIAVTQVSKVPLAGEPLVLTDIKYEKRTPGVKVASTLHYRSKGKGEYTVVELKARKDGAWAGEVSASVTKAPFEYFVQVREAGRKPAVTYPLRANENPIQINPDGTPPKLPAPPKVVSAKHYGVTLAWEAAVDDVRVVACKVYRGDSEGAATKPSSLIAELDPAATAFTDEEPPAGKTAWYAIQPVDVAGRVGAARVVKIDVPKDLPPENMLALAAATGSKTISLSWKGEIERDVTEVIILRADVQGGVFREIATIKPAGSASRWLDKGLKADDEFRYAIKLRDAAGHVSKMSKPVTGAAGGYVRRINCGGPKVIDPDGTVWEADKGVVGGTGFWTVKTDIAAAPEHLQDVYRTERWANHGLRYRFDVDRGHYMLALLFAETNSNFAAAGKRVFAVHINDKVTHEKIDVFAKAGANKAWQLEHEVVVGRGKELVVELYRAAGVGPALKGIEIRALRK